MDCELASDACGNVAARLARLFYEKQMLCARCAFNAKTERPDGTVREDYKGTQVVETEEPQTGGVLTLGKRGRVIFQISSRF